MFYTIIVHLLALAAIAYFVAPVLVEIMVCAYWTIWELRVELHVAIRNGWKPTIRGVLKVYISRYRSHITDLFGYDTQRCGNLWMHGKWPWDSRWRNFDAD